MSEKSENFQHYLPLIRPPLQQVAVNSPPGVWVCSTDMRITVDSVIGYCTHTHTHTHTHTLMLLATVVTHIYTLYWLPQQPHTYTASTPTKHL